MSYKKFVMCIVLILLLAGAAQSSVVASPVGSHLAFPLDLPAWGQVNTNGFGDPTTSEVTALESFNGYLYAGMHNPVDPAPLFDGAQIFRSPDGTSWTAVSQPGFNNPHDTAPPAILDLAIFNGRIYASTGRGNAAQIWRSSNGTTWSPMVAAGFADPDTVDISVLVEYSGALYAGARNMLTGAQVWRSSSGDSGSWTQVAPAVPGSAPAIVTGFAVFSGSLYAAVESENPVEIWQTSGGAWTTLVSDGFGDTNTTSSGGMAVFAGHLYVGAGSTTDGALIWRTNDGAAWEQANTAAFGDANNLEVESLFVFQDQLYASTRNTVTGMEVWRSSNGTTWEQVNQDGFGDLDNTGTNWSNATTTFRCNLYLGTANLTDGGELWEMPQACKNSYFPLVQRPQ